MSDLHDVILRGGSFDGAWAKAPANPGALRLNVADEDQKRSELYLYVMGETAEHPTLGRLPVMRFMERRDEDD